MLERLKKKQAEKQRIEKDRQRIAAAAAAEQQRIDKDRQRIAAAEQQRIAAAAEQQRIAEQRRIKDEERAARIARRMEVIARAAAGKKETIDLLESQINQPLLQRLETMHKINGFIVNKINEISRDILKDISEEDFVNIKIKIDSLKSTINEYTKHLRQTEAPYMLSIETLEQILISKIMKKQPPPAVIEASSKLQSQLGIMGRAFFSIQTHPDFQGILHKIRDEIIIEIGLYDPQPSDAVKESQQNAMLFYRFFKFITNEDFLSDKPDFKTQMKDSYGIDIEAVQFIFYMIGLYRSDPDRDDIVLEPIDPHKYVYYIARNIKPKWWAFLENPHPFIRQLIKTGFGQTIDRMANEEDRLIISEDKLYTILFSNFVFSNLALLTFPSWPVKALEILPVYVGTGPKGSDANCLNFKINNIKKGDEITLLSPITSSSNSRALAIRKFLKPGGVILKINLLTGSSYMCVSESGSDEYETFVLPGVYKFFRKTVEKKGEGEDDIEIYEFNQISEINIPPSFIIDNWTKGKSGINDFVIDSLARYIDTEGERVGMERLDSYAILVKFFKPKGGSSKRKSNKRRKTNKRKSIKRRKSNKRRRTNKRHNSNKRRTKRRI